MAKNIILFYSIADADLPAFAEEFKKTLSGQWAILNQTNNEYTEEMFFNEQFYRQNKQLCKFRIERILNEYIKDWHKNINELLKNDSLDGIIICANSIIVETAYSIQGKFACNDYVFDRLQEFARSRLNFRAIICYPENDDYPKKSFKDLKNKPILMPHEFKMISKKKTDNLVELFHIAKFKSIKVFAK